MYALKLSPHSQHPSANQDLNFMNLFSPFWSSAIKRKCEKGHSIYPLSLSQLSQATKNEKFYNISLRWPHHIYIFNKLKNDRRRKNQNENCNK